MEKQIIPVGYKLTEVGVIPEDWAVEQLENFTSFISYGFTNPMPTTNDGPPMITARDINSGIILLGSARRTTALAYKTLLSAKSKPKINDILLTKDGSLGRLALVEQDGVCINQSVALLRPNERVVPKYMKILLESDFYQSKMLDDAGGSTIKHIYITIVNKMLIHVPSTKQEQTAIANALTDVDALINALEKLINKKTAIKTAAMQQLLTGKKRLPPFDQLNTGYKQTELGEIPKDWEVKTIIESISNIIDYRGVTPKKLGMDWGGDILALSAGNVKKGYIDFQADSYFGSADLYKRWMRNGDSKKGDIVITLEAPLGNVAIIQDDRRYILSQRTILLQFEVEKVVSSFLYQYLLSEEFQSRLSDRATGSTAQGIKRATFELIEVPLPSVEEQTAIANVLSNMDTELNALQQRLAKTQQLKQGMMQELLTGKTRLVTV